MNMVKTENENKTMTLTQRNWIERMGGQVDNTMTIKTASEYLDKLFKEANERKAEMKKKVSSIMNELGMIDPATGNIKYVVHGFGAKTVQSELSKIQNDAQAVKASQLFRNNGWKVSFTSN